MEQKPGEYARIVVSREEYEQFKSQQARISELEQQVTALREALRLAQHKRFGASSEKTVDDGSQQLSFLFNEAEVIADQEAAQDKQETLVAAHKRHKKHEYTLDNSHCFTAQDDQPEARSSFIRMHSAHTSFPEHQHKC